MPATEEVSQPISDTIKKINDELAVGEDLKFQRRWWIFENGIWILFALVVALDLAGAFGRGPLAKAQARTEDGSLEARYERIERFSTPSTLQIKFGPSAIHNGKVELWVSDSLTKTLGNQRVIPQPVSSRVGDAGVLYTFSASKLPASVEFALQPLWAGSHFLTFRAVGEQELKLKIFVMP